MFPSARRDKLILEYEAFLSSIPLYLMENNSPILRSAYQDFTKSRHMDPNAIERIGVYMELQSNMKINWLALASID